MFEIPENIVSTFLSAIEKRSKYHVSTEEGKIVISPFLEQNYYKPVIVVSDVNALKSSLTCYIQALNEFYAIHQNLENYHDLAFFFNNLLLNMTATDASDFPSYINRRTFFFSNTQFSEYQEKKLLWKEGNAEFYIQQQVEAPGLETPFILLFQMVVDGKEYPLPLVRCAIDEENVCYLYAIQFGRGRGDIVTDSDYRKMTNKINSGIHKYRNVPPSFVLTFQLFLKVLEHLGITKIKVPDFLFGRYRNYYRAQTVNKSDAILTRILDKFLNLIQRMEYQFQGFHITSFPNDIDSYTCIVLDETIEDKRNQKKKIIE